MKTRSMLLTILGLAGAFTLAGIASNVARHDSSSQSELASGAMLSPADLAEDLDLLHEAAAELGVAESPGAVSIHRGNVNADMPGAAWPEAFVEGLGALGFEPEAAPVRLRRNAGDNTIEFMNVAGEIFWREDSLLSEMRMYPRVESFWLFLPFAFYRVDSLSSGMAPVREIGAAQSVDDGEVAGDGAADSPRFDFGGADFATLDGGSYSNSIPAQAELPLESFSKTIFVDAHIGDDSYSGRASVVRVDFKTALAVSPKKTINAGLGVAGNGDRLVIASGEYADDINVRGENISVKIEGDVNMRRRTPPPFSGIGADTGADGATDFIGGTIPTGVVERAASPRQQQEIRK